MASCLPYPIPNPSRPGESLKAVPWHLLAVSLRQCKSRNANNQEVRCFASQKLKRSNRIHAQTVWGKIWGDGCEITFTSQLEMFKIKYFRSLITCYVFINCALYYWAMSSRIYISIKENTCIGLLPLKSLNLHRTVINVVKRKQIQNV